MLLLCLQPSSFIDQLSLHKRAMEEEALREKQLEALRVDVCSNEALKRLKGVLPSPSPEALCALLTLP